MKNSTRYYFCGLALAALCSTAFAEELVTADGKKREVGVLRVTGEGVVVRAIEGEKLYRYDDLEAKSAYGFYRRSFDKDNAKGHVAVGKFCLKRRLYEEAKAELAEAKRLDPKLDNEINKIWAEANDEPGRPAPTEEQTKKIVARQLAIGPTVEAATAQTVTSYETDHFVIHTTFPPGDHKLLGDLCEKLYAGFDRIFQISAKNDRMWDGKCLMYLFKDREGFVAFSTSMHRFPGQMAGGYFRARGGMCEVVIPNLSGIDRFKETMVHEGAHAFLHFYRSVGRVPRWVQEGTAQYFEFEEFPKSSMLRMHNRTVTRAVKDGRILTLKALQDSDRPRVGTDTEGYAWCYTYISFLIHTDAKKYAEFVRAMKSGLEPENALQKAFDWDFDAFQTAWLKAVEHLRE